MATSTTQEQRIYIGSYDVFNGLAFGEEHLYLLYDPDLDFDDDPDAVILVLSDLDVGAGFHMIDSFIV